MRFGSIIYGADTKQLLEPISVLQRKALQLAARASYKAHTDILFKQYNFLKYDDLIHLTQCIFMRQYSNKQLPISFKNMFQYLPLSEQVYRDHDYNFVPLKVNMYNLNFFPTVQMVRTWNCSNIFIKCEAEITTMKETFITQCLSRYDEDCVKLNCYICSRT